MVGFEPTTSCMARTAREPIRHEPPTRMIERLSRGVRPRSGSLDRGRRCRSAGLRDLRHGDRSGDGAQASGRVEPGAERCMPGELVGVELEEGVDQARIELGAGESS